MWFKRRANCLGKNMFHCWELVVQEFGYLSLGNQKQYKFNQGTLGIRV